MKTKMLRCMSVVLSVLLMLPVLGGCTPDEAANDVSSDTSGSEVEMRQDANMIILSDEEAMRMATHIMSAEYLGIYVTEYKTELMFAPKDVMKGTVDGGEVIYVVPRSGEISEGDPAVSDVYTEGETYLLVLEKHSSVYYEHSQYVQLGQSLISETDSIWADACDQAARLADSDAPAQYGNPYTEAKALGDIIDFSSNIFTVKVERVLLEGLFDPITAYCCTVTGTVKGTPAENGHIYITMFNGTVEVGGEYLVLLADATESAPVYSLAAREGSVHTLETAASDPELQALLEQVVPYSASEN